MEDQKSVSEKIVENPISKRLLDAFFNYFVKIIFIGTAGIILWFVFGYLSGFYNTTNSIVTSITQGGKETQIIDAFNRGETVYCKSGIVGESKDLLELSHKVSKGEGWSLILEEKRKFKKTRQWLPDLVALPTNCELQIK